MLMMSLGDDGNEMPSFSTSWAIANRLCRRISVAVLCMMSAMFFTFWTARLGVCSTSFRLKEGEPSLDRNGANCRTRDKEKIVGLR